MNLKKLRKKIDKIDKKIIKNISQRNKLIIQVAKFKKEKNITTYQPEREKELFKDRIKTGKKNKLNPKFIKKLFEIILSESKKIQEKTKEED